MANLGFTAVLALSFLLASCASRVPYDLSPPKAALAPLPIPSRGVTSSAPAPLVGSFLTTEKKTIDLSMETEKPVVLIFSQDTCTTCAAEADSLKKSLRHPQENPKSVNVFTVLVGAVAEDAVDWKSFHGIPWTVGIDPDSKLFRQYCNPLTVPCILVYLENQGIALQKNGITDFSELVSITGPWEETSL
jgi:hypothetical protein